MPAKAKQSRVSVKWKLQAFLSGGAKNARPQSPTHTAVSSVRSVNWRLVLHRKCDVRGTVDVEAARGQYPVSLSSSEPFGLCSALLHCEEGDLISLIMFLASGIDDDEEDGRDALDESVNVVGKEFTVLSHKVHRPSAAA